MPRVAVVKLIADEVRRTKFSEQPARNQKIQELLSQLLLGVPLRYSCPLPLWLPEDEEEWSVSEKRIVAELTQGYLADCKQRVQRADVLTAPAQALFEDLFILNDRFPKLILYPSYASGDMYGIGASMVLEPSIRLMSLADTEKTGRIDRAKALKVFLSELVDPKRLTEKKAEPMAYAFIPPFDTQHPKQKKYLEWLNDELWSYFAERGQVYLAVDLFFGTNYIARRFSDDRLQARSTVRSGWAVEANHLNHQVKTKIEGFLMGRGFVDQTTGKLPGKKNVVVLWVRFTGKTGGAHVEYDTSFEGLRQLLKVAADQGNHWAILVGDKPKVSRAFSQEKTARRESKIIDIAASAPLPTLDLTEFWTEDEWGECFDGKARRTDQFKLFEVLNKSNRVKHLGARSGNLESLALLGYEVRYFEDTYQEGDEALDKKRMESWHDPVGYRRIQLSTVPTRSGKYLLQNEDPYPAWTYDRRKAAPQVSKKNQKYVKPSLAPQHFVILPPTLLPPTLLPPTLLPPDDLPPLIDEDEAPVLLFDINPRPQPTPPPPMTFITKVYDKGFQPGDLLKLATYLKPSMFG
ncbi:hypothetical protein [Archangium sp.]|uniref:hypothetical protein n=1 Tax=Archangium sp. TaxID=1872627 RepID=UPI00389AF10E